MNIYGVGYGIEYGIEYGTGVALITTHDSGLKFFEKQKEREEGSIFDESAIPAPVIATICDIILKFCETGSG